MRVKSLDCIFVLFILLASPLAGVLVDTGGTPEEKAGEYGSGCAGGGEKGVGGGREERKLP